MFVETVVYLPVVRKAHELKGVGSNNLAEIWTGRNEARPNVISHDVEREQHGGS
jgi:hypothetical protein